MPRRKSPSPSLPHAQEALLPDGRTLTASQEVSIKGETGRYRFHYLWTPDGSLTCHGPVGKESAQWRSFEASRVKTIYRTTTPTHKEKKESKK